MANMQDIHCTVVIDLPAFQQNWLEGKLASIADELLKPTPRDICHFRPVVSSGVLLTLYIHRDAQCPALFRFVSQRVLGIYQPDHCVRCCCGCTENASKSQKLTSVHPAFSHFTRHFFYRGGNAIAIAYKHSHFSPLCLCC
ncbi:hypothetical protein MPL3356_490029 [Mesorhizobium plurifarium]|uniref:Uncharacterized protein n=1 Tax=Mesorhizobium plurifarium TaxID=69974 RepID=A0A090E5V1_MESPL|nr:hypothetical protein MPL3356_490029 [Mesorhizobium plurifarium]